MLQILNAQSNFLEQVNFTGAPSTLTTSGVGIPLDSFRPDNLTYSAFCCHLLVSYVAARANSLSRKGSNMLTAGFGDKVLQNVIFSGMQSHPLWDDFSISNDTYTLWSARSVRSSCSKLLRPFSSLIPHSPDLASAYAPLAVGSVSPPPPQLPPEPFTKNASPPLASKTPTAASLPQGTAQQHASSASHSASRSSQLSPSSSVYSSTAAVCAALASALHPAGSSVTAGIIAIGAESRSRCCRTIAQARV